MNDDESLDDPCRCGHSRFWHVGVGDNNCEFAGILPCQCTEFVDANRLDVMPALLEALRTGRARVVSRRPYEVNGRRLVSVEIEWPDPTEQLEMLPNEERP